MGMTCAFAHCIVLLLIVSLVHLLIAYGASLRLTSHAQREASIREGVGCGTKEQTTGGASANHS